MTYSQGDPRWSSLDLGVSRYTMGTDGCLTTALAQALYLAGWTDLDPGTVCTELSQGGGYTDAAYQYGPGLLIWSKVADCSLSEFHFRGVGESGGAYAFVQVVISGKYLHWVLRKDGVFYDPLDATSGPLKATYRPTGDVKTADIDPAPVEAPSRFPLTVTVKGPLGLRVRTAPDSGSQMVDPDTLQPSQDAQIDPGNSFTAVDEVDGQDPYGDGRNRWLKTTHGFYVWNRDNY